MLRGQRSVQQEKQRNDRRRELVMKALQDRYRAQSDDRLMSHILGAIPRTTPKMIATTIQKVRSKDEVGADKLEEALNQCENLAENLNGAHPEVLWSDAVRMLWSESLGAILGQTSNWKATPVVAVHPFAGKLVVLTSLYGRFQTQNEYARMKEFEEELRNGLEDVLNDIHPVKDDATGVNVDRAETRSILLDISNGGANDANEEELSEECSEDEECEAYDRFNSEIQAAAEDWSSDPAPSPTKSPKKVVTLATPLTSTPPARPNSSLPRSESSLSSFSSPLPGIETSILSTSTQRQPTRPSKGTPAPVVRSLFQPAMELQPPAQPTPAAKSTSSHLAEAFPQGYSVVPHRQKSPKKTDQKKSQRKEKRPINSPNYPASKNSRLDATETAIAQIQMHQVSQSEALQNLANQIGTLAMNLALNISTNKKD